MVARNGKGGSAPFASGVTPFTHGSDGGLRRDHCEEDLNGLALEFSIGAEELLRALTARGAVRSIGLLLSFSSK